MALAGTITMTTTVLLTTGTIPLTVTTYKASGASSGGNTTGLGQVFPTGT